MRDVPRPAAGAEAADRARSGDRRDERRPIGRSRGSTSDRGDGMTVSRRPRPRVPGADAQVRRARPQHDPRRRGRVGPQCRADAQARGAAVIVCEVWRHVGRGSCRHRAAHRASFARRGRRRFSRRARDWRGPVVVVSALGGATDRLLGLAAEAGAGDIDGAREHVRALCARHLEVAGVITNADGARRRRSSSSDRNSTSSSASSARSACSREVSPRWLDAIAATGEILSSRIVAAALTSHGLAAGWVDARKAIVTDGEHTAAAPLWPETTEALQATVDPVLVAAPHSRHRRFRRRHERRRHDDARARRIGLLGGDHRRVPGRDGDPDLDRRGRHADRRSAHRHEHARRAASVVRRSVRARVLRRQGAAPGDDSAGGRQEHSGPHPEFAAAVGRRWHARHARAARPAAVR